MMMMMTMCDVSTVMADDDLCCYYVKLTATKSLSSRLCHALPTQPTIHSSQTSQSRSLSGTALDNCWEKNQRFPCFPGF